MRKIYLLFGFALTFGLGYSQTNLTLGAPLNNGSTTQLRAPNGTSTHTTLRGHLIVSAAEMAGIPSGTVINGLGFLYSAGADIPAGGTIQFYLENTTDATNLKSTTWATAISTMTNVYNGTYSIPVVAGSTNVSLTSSFTYTGGGVYVAYDYLGTTFSTLPATYLCNTAIGGGVKVDATATTTPPATLTGSSGFRPEIEFSFPNPYTNNIAVNGLFAGRGQANLLLGSTQSIETQITNVSSGTLLNIPVSLSITGANPYSTSQIVPSLAPGASTSVNFMGVPQTNQGTQTVVVSVPPDQQTSNDSYSLVQDIFCDTVGYAYGDTITGGLGYNTGTGIFANLLVIPVGQPIYIKKVVPTISQGTTNVGNIIKGVLLNSAGVIVDSTANHIITAANLGKPVKLTFINGATNYAGDSVYFGFRQSANATTGYFPLATQDITGFVPADLFCGFNAYGGGYANYTEFGIGLISAVLSPSVNYFSASSNASGGVICAGTSLNISASAGYPNYIFDVDGSIAQSGTASAYSYIPTTTTTAIVTAPVGLCIYKDTIVASQVSAVTSSNSASVCAGNAYNFNGQMLTSAGTYLDTMVSSAGCDSIITLNLSLINPSSSALTETLCATNYLFGGQNLTVSGIYYDTLVNALGCDSVVALNLTLNPPVSVSVVQSGINLTATVTPSTANLQWIECPANTPIAGANGTVYSPTAVVGSYAVIATEPLGCADTSTCFIIDQTGIEKFEKDVELVIYPNPSTDVVHVESKDLTIVGYFIVDINGRILSLEKLKATEKTIDLKISSFDPGVYFITVETSEGIFKKSFVKK